MQNWKGTEDNRVFLAGVEQGPTERQMERAVRAAAGAVTDFSWLSRGDAVFIKPALNSGRPYPATTSPLAVKAMVRLLRDKGAGRVLVGDMAGIEDVKLTSGGVKGSTRKLMHAAGMADPVQEAGAELHFFEEAGWNAFSEEYPEAGSSWKRGLMMPDILGKVDHVILMPRCARHTLLGCTLGMKAAVGYWRTDTRLEYHRDAASIQAKTAEGNTVPSLLRKQRLVISAADKVLSTFGPNQGHVVQPEHGLVMASRFVMAHDMVSLAWLLFNRSNVRFASSGLRDPYNSQAIVSLGNRWVVNLLGGIKPALGAEKISRKDIRSIWDEPVLQHSFELNGGIPEIMISSMNIPEEIRGGLEQMTTLEARG